ncbi:MAG: glycosyltransferase family 4 protein [Bryobacteraceae bacterium]|jgi:glycosyltransferase involved in cell wall biosynthesis
MSRPLRVLTVGHSYCVALNRALVREVARDPDFEITVAAPDFFQGDLRPIDMEAEPSGSPLRLVPLHTKLSRFIHIFSYDRGQLQNLIRKGEFDVVHAWEEPYILAGYQIAAALKQSASRFCFRTAQSYVKHYPPPFGYFERTVLARAQGWIAGAGLVFQAMLKRGYPERTGRVLNLAVDLTQFKPLSGAERAQVLQELQLTPPVVGFVGRLTKAKGLDVLMQAMDRVGQAPPWSLLFLGSGDYSDKINEWAAQRGWSDRVKILLAKHGDVPRYLGCMDLMVAPSQTTKNWREQFGRMIIEAFGCGVPVIGSDSGEIPHVIGDAGKVVSESNVAAWAEAVRSLLEDSAERDHLRKRGLERAPRYSVATIAQQYRDYYRWLAGRPLQNGS